MGSTRITAGVAASVVALSSMVTVGVLAVTQSSGQAAAPQLTGTAAGPRVEARVNKLLGQMTVDEKLKQLELPGGWQITDADAKAGVGSVLGSVDPAQIDHLQHVAVTQSRLHIPILFAYDTIHGYRTIFPVPLGAASSFDPSVVTADDTIAARETATVGIKQSGRAPLTLIVAYPLPVAAATIAAPPERGH